MELGTSFRGGTGEGNRPTSCLDIGVGDEGGIGSDGFGNGMLTAGTGGGGMSFVGTWGTITTGSLADAGVIDEGDCESDFLTEIGIGAEVVSFPGTSGSASGSSGGITTGGSVSRGISFAVASAASGTVGGGSLGKNRAYTVTPTAATAAMVTSQ